MITVILNLVVRFALRCDSFYSSIVIAVHLPRYFSVDVNFMMHLVANSLLPCHAILNPLKALLQPHVAELKQHQENKGTALVLKALGEDVPAVEKPSKVSTEKPRKEVAEGKKTQTKTKAANTKQRSS